MILEAKDLNYYYQDGEQRRYVLKDTSVSFEKGKFYTILGQSGSGKTTLLSLLSALDSPHSGTVLSNEKDIKKIGYENRSEEHTSELQSRGHHVCRLLLERTNRQCFPSLM